MPQSYYDSLRDDYRRGREVLLGYLSPGGLRVSRARRGVLRHDRYHPVRQRMGRCAVRPLDDRELGVSAVPGSSFYSPRELGRTKVRFMFAKREETLHQAGQRLLTLRERLPK